MDYKKDVHKFKSIEKEKINFLENMNWILIIYQILYNIIENHKKVILTNKYKIQINNNDILNLTVEHKYPIKLLKNINHFSEIKRKDNFNKNINYYKEIYIKINH